MNKEKIASLLAFYFLVISDIVHHLLLWSIFRNHFVKHRINKNTYCSNNYIEIHIFHSKNQPITN